MDEERGTQYRPQGDEFYYYAPVRKPQPVKTGNTMSAASLAVGIIALVLSFFTGIFGITMGALGIILAILSKDRGKLPSQAKLGLGFSIAGLLLGVMVFAAALMLINTGDFKEQIENELQSYGYDFDFGDSDGTENSGGYEGYSDYGNGYNDFSDGYGSYGDGYNDYSDGYGNYGDIPGYGDFGDDFGDWNYGDGIDGGYESNTNGENIL